MDAASLWLMPVIGNFVLPFSVLLNGVGSPWSVQAGIQSLQEIVGGRGQVLGGVGGHHTAAEGRHLMLGNMFLLLNTLAMACYYLR